MSELLRFYRDQPNPSGYTYSQVMEWPDQEWDAAHDFVQWLFPTDEGSRFNPKAPVLTPEDVKAFGEDDDVRWRYVHALARAREFLCMYPFSYGQRAWWDSPSNHNMLRVSRIIRSIALLRGREEAEEFRLDAELVSDSASAEARGFWKKNVEAVIGGGHEA